MTEASTFDHVDSTPGRVFDGMIMSHTACKRDKPLPCGAIVKMGFFFDGFGRHRDIDDPTTSRYSNICRLWEAHRNNLDSRRKDSPNEFWYRFYYSGLGTPLNKDAENCEIVSAAVKVTASATKAAANSVLKSTGVPDLLNLPKTAGKTAAKALKEAFDEKSWRPIAKNFDDLIRHARTAGVKVGRVLAPASSDEWVTRGRAAAREALYDIKKNPLKALSATAKAIAVDVGIETIPAVRDSKAASMVFGTGVEDRLQSALKQFEAAFRDAKSKMEKFQRIEVSVFGADRGGVIARAFVNELVRKYKRRTDLDLRIGLDPRDKGEPIEIRFLGLLDAVSSLMAEDKLISYVPLVNTIKQHHGDRKLGVPAAVRRCVHFAAAHELRFYQRLDSLEKTRGEQYLYPGTSEDITGGAPPGTLGFRAELQRVALRDMLHEGLMAGARLDTMECLFNFKGPTFRKFTLAAPLSHGNATYKIRDLIDAYRELVPRKQGLDFQSHMQVFLRWLAVRYQSPTFRMSMADYADVLEDMSRDREQEAREAEAAYNAERMRKPTDLAALGKADARMMDAQAAELKALHDAMAGLARPIMSVWDRLGEEAAENLRLESLQKGLKESEARIRKAANELTSLYYQKEMESAANTVQSVQMDAGSLALAKAWKDGAEGRNPLPEKVMVLFDMLVHDTMLTSWHDHVLSSTLYFQTRATDAFGETDEQKEQSKRDADERAAQRIDKMPKMGMPGAHPR